MTDPIDVEPLAAGLTGEAHALLAGVIGHGWWSAGAFGADVAAPDRIWLSALDGDAVVGVAGAARIAAETELLALGVAPAHRGRGVARRLLEEVASRAAAAGAERLSLEVRSGNEAARALYRSVGLRRAGRRPGYYGDGEDALLLAADLPLATPHRPGS